MISKKIHFSVDDTFGCFKWLNKNCKSKNEIFVSTTFSYAKFVYETFGIGTSFYCMYTDGIETLEVLGPEWSEQFQKCCTWMKFGFHGYDGNANYSMASIDEFMKDYRKVMDALTRITGGGKCFTDTLRLHYFSGNETIAAYLKKQGINNLLCADDNRGSYGLTKEVEKKVKLTGFYLDANTGIRYMPTNFRVENIHDIKNEIEKIECIPYDNLTIFTHERYLKDMEIRNKLERLLREII